MAIANWLSCRVAGGLLRRWLSSLVTFDADLRRPWLFWRQSIECDTCSSLLEICSKKRYNRQRASHAAHVHVENGWQPWRRRLWCDIRGTVKRGSATKTPRSACRRWRYHIVPPLLPMLSGCMLLAWIQAGHGLTAFNNGLAGLFNFHVDSITYRHHLHHNGSSSAGSLSSRQSHYCRRTTILMNSKCR